MHIFFVAGLAEPNRTAIACILRQMVVRSGYWQTYRRWLLFLSGLSRWQNVELEFGGVFRLWSKTKRLVSLVGSETISSGFLHADSGTL